MIRWWLLAILVGLAPAARAEDTPKPKAEAVKPAEKEYAIPYRLTDTKHVLVRVKINGKGPFNLILDTGAPAVFITKKSAQRAGLDTDDNGWAATDTFELEGGLTVPSAKVRVADLFQLEGMNGMGLAGVELHGVVGYNVLAKFRITYDFTGDKLAFVALDYTPPAVNARGKDNSQGSLDMLGPVMKTLAMFAGIKPNFDVAPRGFLGVELAPVDGKLTVKGVLKGSPADVAGMKVGDIVTGASPAFTKGDPAPGSDTLDDLREFGKWVEKIQPGQMANVLINRGGKTVTVTVEFGKGL